jgi:hypothetical protein
VGVVVSEYPFASGSVQGQRIADAVWPALVGCDPDRRDRDPKSTPDLQVPAVKTEERLKIIVPRIISRHVFIST